MIIVLCVYKLNVSIKTLLKTQCNEKSKLALCSEIHVGIYVCLNYTTPVAAMKFIKCTEADEKFMEMCWIHQFIFCLSITY